MITRQWTQDHQKRINQYIKEGEVIERGEEGLLAIELKEGEIVYVQEKDSFLAKGIIGRLKVGDLVLVSGFETEEGFEVFKIRPRINRKNFLNEINDEEKRNNTWIGREENPRFNNFKQ